MDRRRSKTNIPRPGNLLAAVVIMVVVELITMPGNLIVGQDAAVEDQQDSSSTGTGISVMNVNSVIVDKENVKWFSTSKGLLSFDGTDWKLYDENKKLPNQDLKGVTYVGSPEGSELWIASPNGATVARLPLDDQADAYTYNPENGKMVGTDVLGIAAGNDSIRWIGTDKGISALMGDKWLKPYYDLHYPDRMFKVFPITSMATNQRGDSLYVGTEGAGVLRVFRDNLDGISGASVYAEWGPIIMPSDNIQSIFIAPDGTKWFGTKKGIAKHTGNETLDNWTVYTTDDGLVHDFVQAITGDSNGNIWFGTKEGISVFNGSSWVSYTTDNGLASNNILSLAIDQDGMVWIGTDTGISSFENEKFTNY
jgi:ligand-binding sensor domain-containing protein